MRQRVARLAEAVRGIWSGPLMSSSPELARLWGAPATSTGMGVNETTALTYSAFWACVNAIATDCASLPLILYKRAEGGGKSRYVASRLYHLLHDEPNPEMTSMTFRQTLTAHALTWGGGYAEIERDGADRPRALWPLTPDRVTPARTAGQQIVYRITRADGGYDELPAHNVLHIPGLGFDGLVGYSVVAKARESIGLGLATERFGGTFFGNGSTFGGVISLGPGEQLTEQAKKNFREMNDATHNGVDRAHKFLLLANQAKYERLGIPPEDAQFLETRLHQVEEMCRWFRMPPHKIQHLLRATNNNIEHQGIEYYSDTLRAWLVRWEQEINRKLIPSLERRQQFTEHLIEGVQRGDLASRYAAYAVGRQWGWLSVDDIRERENMNPLADGQGTTYLVPLNMVPADRLNDVIDKQVEPTPAPIAPVVPAADDDPTGRALEAIQAALVAAEARVQSHLAAAAAADARALTLEGTAEQHETDATIQRDAAAAAQQEVSRLQALNLEAQERSIREQADRDGLKAALEAQAASHLEALAIVTQAVTAADAEVLRIQGDVAISQQAVLDAQARAAVLEQEAAAERASAGVALEGTSAAQQERDRVQAELGPAREAQRLAELALEQATSQLTDAEGRAAVERAALEHQVADERASAAAALSTADQVRFHLTAAVETHQAALVEAQLALASSEAREKKDHEWRETLSETAELLTTHLETHKKRLADVSVAVRAAVVDRLAWMVEHESDRARAKQGSPEKLRKWVDDFYTGDFSDRCRTILRPSVKAWVVCMNHPEPVEHLLDLLIAQHVEQSVRQLRAVANEHDVETLPAALEKVLRRWEASRADTLADRILKEAA